MTIQVLEELANTRVGHVSQVQDGKAIGTKFAEEAITPGKFVTYGTSVHQMAYPTSAGEVTAGLGFAIYQSMRTLDDNGDYAAGESDGVNYLKRGTITVNCLTAATAGQPVFVRHTSGDLGTVRNDADTTNATELPNARFVGTIPSAGSVDIEVNLPG